MQLALHTQGPDSQLVRDVRVRETRHSNPEESFRMASALLVSPGAPLSVSLPGVGEGTRFVLTRVRREERFS